MVDRETLRVQQTGNCPFPSATQLCMMSETDHTQTNMPHVHVIQIIHAPPPPPHHHPPTPLLYHDPPLLKTDDVVILGNLLGISER